MFEVELLKELIEANKIIVSFKEGKISFQELVNQYDNFYYSLALDGHEAKPEEKKIIEKYSELISVHRFLQTQVLDLILPKNLESYNRVSGRITANDAEALIRENIDKESLKSWNQRLIKSSANP